MYVHTDEVLFDPLPQPYRFLNKILLQTIENCEMFISTAAFIANPWLKNSKNATSSVANATTKFS